MLLEPQDRIITNFGEVKIGPVFKKYIDDCRLEMGRHSKRTKAHQFAKKQLEDAERAVCVYATVHWAADKDMRKTP